MKSIMQRQPSREILGRYQRQCGVCWLAVDRRAIRALVEEHVADEKPFTKELAIIDLHYAISMQEVEPYRHYCERWKWSPKRVYRVFVELGIYGSKGANDAGAAGVHQGSCDGAPEEQKHRKPPGKRHDEEHEGSTRGLDGEQREPSYIYPISRSISTSGGDAREARVRDAPGAGSQPKGATHRQSNDTRQGHQPGGRNGNARDGSRKQFSSRRTDEEFDREIAHSAGLLGGICDGGK